MRTALTIAGSDSSGGAGIQADIKTMTMNGVFAMSAITALTAQNTTGVTGILNSTPEFLAQQLDAVFTDIYPDAVKIGMVSSQELIRVIAVQIADAFILHSDASVKELSASRMIIWLVGFVIYRILMNIDFVLGNTLPDMLITMFITVVWGLCVEKNKSKA